VQRSDGPAGVRDVAFATGFMGDPVAGQFADRDAFAHLFCTWYLLHRPDTCWVVDDGGGRVVGYLVGSPDGPGDQAAHEWEFATTHLLRRGIALRPGTARFIARAAVDLARDRRCLHPPVDPARFPAELHVNLLPEARGRGLGGALMRSWTDRLVGMGVPGVHLGTFGQNAGAIAFFTACGFEPVGAEVPNPGFRMLDGGRCTVRWFQRALP